MEGGSPQKRGRARGRARAVSAGPSESQSPPPDGAAALQTEALKETYPEKRESEGSSSGGSQRGSAAGTPRGMSPRPTPRNYGDFVSSRPTTAFVKKVEPADPRIMVTVATNYYKLKQHPKWSLSLYTVKIAPVVEDERLIRWIVGSRRELLGSYLLRGFQLFTTRTISEDLLKFKVQRQPDEPEYSAELAFSHQVAEDEPLVIQFYNILIRKVQDLLEFHPIGRHYFQPGQARDFPNLKLKLWPGFQNSIRQQECGLLLNVESVWKVCQTDSILVIIENKKRQFNHEAQDQAKRAINEELSGMMVVTNYGKRAKTYKVDHVDFESNPESNFPTKDGNVVYFQYYKDRYGITIRDMKQPLLVCLPKERDRRRGMIGNILLVPELCFPCGLTDRMRADFRLMKELGVCLHMAPDTRVRTMDKFVTSMTNSEQVVDYLKQWGLKLESAQPVSAPARMLPPEKIFLGKDVIVKPEPKTADWTKLMIGNEMLANKGLHNWVVVTTTRDSANLDNLLKTMKNVAKGLGFPMDKPLIKKVNGPRDLAQGVGDVYAEKKGDVDFFMIILPNPNLDTYADVKKRCSIRYGIPSQCFLAKNMTARGVMSIATKVVIQINAKQGGIPWGVSNQLAKKNVMVLGYDVHHAGPKGGESVGAMSASMDGTLGSYFSAVSDALRRMEVGTSQIQTLFDECLKAYYKRNSTLPEKIFMYRDGVGEGQLEDVYNLEIQSFKDRIAHTYAEKKQAPPKLTFIVVNKRINTRFFRDTGNRNYENPHPGMVVDDVVTRPERYDFYLVSQTARQGCVSPTSYNILVDEAELGPDKLQKFTWKLCHMYFNWSGTVAVPAPCQNAHKLALLVGTALKGRFHKNLEFLLHYL